MKKNYTATPFGAQVEYLKIQPLLHEENTMRKISMQTRTQKLLKIIEKFTLQHHLEADLRKPKYCLYFVPG